MLIFKFLENRWEDKTLWTEWEQESHILNLLCIYLSMQFWFITVITKYLNFATFSMDLLAITNLWFYPAFWWRDITYT